MRPVARLAVLLLLASGCEPFLPSRDAGTVEVWPRSSAALLEVQAGPALAAWPDTPFDTALELPAGGKTLQQSTGTVAAQGTVDVQRPLPGVTFRLSGSATGRQGEQAFARGAQVFAVCVAGAEGQRARFTLRCAGGLAQTEGGKATLRLGTVSQPSRWCDGEASPARTRLFTTPAQASELQVVSLGQACLDVALAWGVEPDGASARPGTASLSLGEVVVTAALE